MGTSLCEPLLPLLSLRLPLLLLLLLCRGDAVTRGDAVMEIMAKVQLHHMLTRSTLGFDGTVEAAACPGMVWNHRHAECSSLLLAAATRCTSAAMALVVL